MVIEASMYKVSLKCEGPFSWEQLANENLQIKGEVGW
jgi:hypothetical protein